MQRSPKKPETRSQLPETRSQLPESRSPLNCTVVLPIDASGKRSGAVPIAKSLQPREGVKFIFTPAKQMGKKLIYTEADEQLYTLKTGRGTTKKYDCYHKGCPVFVSLASGILADASGQHCHPSQQNIMLRLRFEANVKQRCADGAEPTAAFECEKER